MTDYDYNPRTPFQAYEDGRNDERARIVAWLRGRADGAAVVLCEEEREIVSAYLRATADMIEARPPVA